MLTLKGCFELDEAVVCVDALFTGFFRDFSHGEYLIYAFFTKKWLMFNHFVGGACIA